MPAVGRYKKENGMKIYQPKREQEILVSKKQQAKKLGLDVGLIQKIFKLILKDSRKIQNKYFKPSKQ